MADSASENGVVGLFLAALWTRCFLAGASGSFGNGAFFIGAFYWGPRVASGSSLDLVLLVRVLLLLCSSALEMLLFRGC